MHILILTLPAEIVTYIQGPRQFPQLVVRRYKYIKHRSSHKATYWKCHLYDSGLCKARCIIGMDQTLMLSGHHSHLPDLNSYEDVTVLSHELFYLVRSRTFMDEFIRRLGTAGDRLGGGKVSNLDAQKLQFQNL